MEGPLLPGIQRLVGLADIHRLLQELSSQARDVESDLDALQANTLSTSARVASAQSATEEVCIFCHKIPLRAFPHFGITCHVSVFQALGLALADAEVLADTISTTAGLSERVSRKVRELDTTTCRVRECLDQTDHLLLRARAATGAQEALDNSDFEAAADHVRHYLEFGTGAEQSGMSNLEQEQVKLLTLLCPCFLSAVLCNAMQLVIGSLHVSSADSHKFYIASARSSDCRQFMQ